MTPESRQENHYASHESLQHKAWVSLTTALGMPLTIALAVLVVAIIIVLMAGLIFSLAWYLSPIIASENSLSITERKDLVQGLASVAQAAAVGLTGAAGFIGLAFTWRNLRQTRESTQRTLELTEQGQITERFTRAIDQLGATDDKGKKKLEIRLGGIYALERIDKESPGRAYHGTVMEVLTAYVRENSRRDTEEPLTSTSASNEAAEEDKDIEQAEEPTVRRPPADIQAILDVLKRRENVLVPVHHRRVELDLGGADLRGAFLSSIDLQHAILHRADLRGAILREANLQYAILGEADLQGAWLEGANLQNAIFYGADLQGAWLEGANLQGAGLQGADLRGARLRGASLQEALLGQAKGLAQEQIDWAIGDEAATLPDGLVRPAAWSKSIEEQMHILEKRLE